MKRPDQGVSFDLLRSGSRWSAWACWLVVGIGFSGCQDAAIPTALTVAESDAERDFDWIIQRLHHAIRAMKPPQDLGLRIEREMEYELLPPVDKNSNYRAFIEFTTTRILDHEILLGEPGASKPKKVQPLPRVELESPFVDPNSRPEPGSLADLESIPKVEHEPLPTITDAVPPQRIKSAAKFELEYRAGKWELLNQPTDETDKQLLDYAMQK